MAIKYVILKSSNARIIKKIKEVKELDEELMKLISMYKQCNQSFPKISDEKIIELALDTLIRQQKKDIKEVCCYLYNNPEVPKA
jgi:hypothetical protein